MGDGPSRFEFDERVVRVGELFVDDLPFSVCRSASKASGNVALMNFAMPAPIVH